VSNSVRQCPTVFDSVQQCSTVSNSVRQCPTVFDSVQQCSTVSNSVRQCPTVFDSVQHAFSRPHLAHAVTGRCRANSLGCEGHVKRYHLAGVRPTGVDRQDFHAADAAQHFLDPGLLCLGTWCVTGGQAHVDVCGFLWLDCPRGYRTECALGAQPADIVCL
jgi:hypothetical protein